MADEAIVLAGGLGTRLRAAVAQVPKPLAPVASRPFLGWLLDRLAGAGMRRCILATGYRSDMIEQAVGARWRGMDKSASKPCWTLSNGSSSPLANRAAPRILIQLKS